MRIIYEKLPQNRRTWGQHIIANYPNYMHFYALEVSCILVYVDTFHLLELSAKMSKVFIRGHSILTFGMLI